MDINKKIEAKEKELAELKREAQVQLVIKELSESTLPSSYQKNKYAINHLVNESPRMRKALIGMLEALNEYEQSLT